MPNKSEIIISAKDDTKTAFNAIENRLKSFGNSLPSIGAGITFAGLTSLIKSSIDAADHLNDLSKITSLTVETLSGLSGAAKESGSDLDGIAESIQKLSVNMGKNSDKFQAIGVTAKDPLEAFKQLADVLNAIEDPQKRSAAAQTALGKSYASAMPLIAEGSNGIQTLVDKHQALSKVTKETAERADLFNGKLDQFNTRLQGLVTSGVGPLLETGLQLTEYFEKTTEAADGTNAAMFVIDGTFKAVAISAARLKFALTEAGDILGLTVARTQALATLDFKGLKNINAAGRENLEKSLKDLQDFENKLLNKDGRTIKVELPKKPDPQPNKSGDNSAINTFIDPEAAAKASADVQKAYDQKLAFFKKSQEDLAALILDSTKLNDVDKSSIDVIQDKLNAYSALDPAVHNYIQGQLDIAKAAENATVFDEAFARGLENEADLFNEQLDTERAYAQQKSDIYTELRESLNKENEDLNIDLITSDKKRAQAQLDIERDRVIESIRQKGLEFDLQEELVNKALDNYKLKSEAITNGSRDDFKDLQRAIEGFGKSSADAFVDFAFTGKASVGDLVDNLLKDLAKLTIYKGVTQPIFDEISSVFSSSKSGGIGSWIKDIFPSFGGGKAVGGAVDPSQYYMVGEKGPELFVPSSAGSIIPNNALHSGGGNISISVNVDATGSSAQGNTNSGLQLGRLIGVAVQSEIIKQKMPGGLLT